MNITDDMIYDPSAYIVSNFDDEIRVDKICRELLKRFHQHLMKDKEPLIASSMAAGADYFLRDFMIDNQRTNIFELNAQRVRSFADNWYIVSNLEPNSTELESLLSGVAEFCQFCAEHKMTDPEQAQQAAAACREIDYYSARIESFHAITGDGFAAWNAACRPETKN
jgi:hypothetical protein